jgi:hypothetical protein
MRVLPILAFAAVVATATGPAVAAAKGDRAEMVLVRGGGGGGFHGGGFHGGGFHGGGFHGGGYHGGYYHGGFYHGHFYPGYVYGDGFLPSYGYPCPYPAYYPYCSYPY